MRAVPFGYVWTADGKTLIPHEGEQRAIACMRQWREQKKTYRDMVTLLEKMGIECKESGSICARVRSTGFSPGRSLDVADLPAIGAGG